MPHKDPEARRKYAREYHKKNKAKKNAASMKWYRENFDKIQEQNRRRYIKNIDYYKEYRERTKEHRKEYDKMRWRKNKALEYGVDLSILPEVLVCEICGADEGRMAFDHNHETNAFRGILCSHCNVALGMAKDSPELLQKMINYLQERGSYSKL